MDFRSAAAVNGITLEDVSDKGFITKHDDGYYRSKDNEKNLDVPDDKYRDCLKVINRIAQESIVCRTKPLHAIGRVPKFKCSLPG